MRTDWLRDNIHIARHLRRLPPGPVISYLADAGLANRLRAWFFASCLAARHGRIVVHRWRRNSAFGAGWQECFAADGSDGHSADRARWSWRRICAPPDATASAGWIDHPLPAATAILARSWQYAPAERWIRDSFPDPALVAAFRAAVLGPEQRIAEAIGVHVRLGDFHEIAGVRPIAGYLEATSDLLDTQPALQRIIVCSDQIEQALPPFITRFGAHRVESSERPGEAHLRSDAEAARRALAQFRRLARCEACVLTPGSSFGAMAAALGAISPANIRHA